MANKLRDDIRKYETENNTKLRCKFSRLRCLLCPFSFIGCSGARWQLTERLNKR